MKKIFFFLVSILSLVYFLSPTLTKAAVITHIQSTSKNSTSTASNQVTTFTSPVTTGNTTIVAVSVFANTGVVTINSVTDNFGNTYTKASEKATYNSSMGWFNSTIWYSNIATGGSNFAITITPSRSSLITSAIHEYSGVLTPNSLDRVATGNGTGTNAVTSATTTTSQDDELVFASFMHQTLSSSVGSTAANGFTIRQKKSGGGYLGLTTEDKIVNTIGAYTGNLTWASSTTWDGNVATFKAAGSQPTTSPTPSASPSPTPTPTSSPTPTPSPSPSPEPTATPTPTLTPSPEPTVMPTETPTMTPTATPTPSPTPSPSPSPSPTPTMTPVPTPTPTFPATNYQIGQHAYTSPIDGREYLLYLPNNYASAPEGGWPLMMFVHGYGIIVGSSDVWGIAQEPLPGMLQSRSNFPFVVVSPRLYDSDLTSESSGWIKDSSRTSLFNLISLVQAGANINSNKVSITGYSMGGGVSWNMGLTNPSIFAAVAPVAGFYQSYTNLVVPTNICNLFGKPVKVYHGSNDATVNVSIAQGLVNAVNACGDPDSASAIISNWTHDSIREPVFSNNDDLYNWILQQSLGSTPNPTTTPNPTASPVSTPSPTPTPSPTQNPNGTFPSTSILDNFNRANGSIGSAWRGNTSRYQISNSQLLSNNNSNSLILYNTIFGSNQEVEVLLSNIKPTASEINLILKSQGTSQTSAMIEVWYSPIANRIEVWTNDSSNGWVQKGVIESVTLSANDLFGARALSNGNVEVYKNSGLLGTVSVSGWPFINSSGRIGIWTSGASTSLFDNFRGGTFQ